MTARIKTLIEMHLIGFVYLMLVFVGYLTLGKGLVYALGGLVIHTFAYALGFFVIGPVLHELYCGYKEGREQNSK